jgi:ABC-2 type transport system permease protein
MSVGIEVAILGSLGTVFVVVARVLLRRLERIARREGRLTVRWL